MRFKALFSKAIYAVFALVAFSASAQNYYTKQVIIVSGGQFGNPNNLVRVGAYDPAINTYTVFDSIPAPSTKTVLVEGNHAYVTADTLIAKYDLDSRTRIALGSASALNSPGGFLAVYEDFLLATRGYGADSDFVYVYNKNDLSLAHKVKGISNQAAGIVVSGDSAYVAVAGPWGKDTGTIAVINLKTMQLSREIMLDTLGAGIGKMYSDGTYIYAVCSGRNIIVKLETATGNVTYLHVGKSIYNGSGLAKNMLYADINYMGIGAVNTMTGQVENEKIVDFAGLNTFTDFVAGSIYDSVAKRFYVTSTDYSTRGRAFIYNETGTAIDTFTVGISPEAITIDHRMVNSIYNTPKKSFSLQIYPNPASTTIQANIKISTNATVTITDVTGKIMRTNSISISRNRLEINIEDLPQGVYNLSIYDSNTLYNSKLIKL